MLFRQTQGLFNTLRGFGGRNPLSSEDVGVHLYPKKRYFRQTRDFKFREA
ncbi:hypothetical protein BVAVS116_H0014 (plasmid) [Borreliella valaisiana VS116]|uniref:Uncharacterized protein n=1 Tax=Borreliella valaisiana VS116 TaxID=445987 RepID=C0R971_BORVA|nr:hypothetical protein BVAVS116_H0014 [Borreliella valaisiana VS116]